MTVNANQPAAETWDETLVRVFKANEIRLVAYVPDKVLAPLIKRLHADDYFTVICPAREEEAVGIVSGAYMAGLRGIVRSEEHTSELQSPCNSYAVFCLKKKKLEVN